MKLKIESFDKSILIAMLNNHPHSTIKIINDSDIPYEDLERVRDYMIYHGVSCSFYDGILKLGGN